MKFSILMSLYHGENAEFLDLSLRSVWTDQKIAPNEVIFVIDGPISDNLICIVEKWKKTIGTSFKTVFLHQNVGLGNALNEGLKHCSNDWVFRMDTDDICTPDRFEKQIEFIQQNPDVVLFGGQILEFDQNVLDANILKAVPVRYEDIKKFAQKRCPFNHMTVAYRKDVIYSLGGYKHHLFMEDYNLWLRIMGAGYKMANLKDVILYARVGNGMHARRKGYEYIKSEKQLLNLKKELKLQSPIHANMLFLIRSAFRLMSSSMLGKFYNIFLRKKVTK